MKGQTDSLGSRPLHIQGSWEPPKLSGLGLISHGNRKRVHSLLPHTSSFLPHPFITTSDHWERPFLSCNLTLTFFSSTLFASSSTRVHSLNPTNVIHSFISRLLFCNSTTLPFFSLFEHQDRISLGQLDDVVSVDPKRGRRRKYSSRHPWTKNKRESSWLLSNTRSDYTRSCR